VDEIDMQTGKVKFTCEIWEHIHIYMYIVYVIIDCVYIYMYVYIYIERTINYPVGQFFICQVLNYQNDFSITTRNGFSASKNENLKP
jgi:hypothetical protein